MSLTLNKGIGTNSYRVTTYTADIKNACGCNRYGLLALKQRNSTLRHTSCTCCAKFTLWMDHNSFFLVCGFGGNQHTDHPPLLSNKIRNCKRFFAFLRWKLLLQWVLPTSSPPKLLCSPKPVPIRSLLVVRWHRCKDSQKWRKSWWLPHCWCWCYRNTIWVVALQQYADLFTKKLVPHTSVCITKAKQKKFVGTVPRLHELPEDNAHDVSHELTSLSDIPTDYTSPFHQKSVPLDNA